LRRRWEPAERRFVYDVGKAMIGKSLNDRHTLGALPPERAVALLTEAMRTQAEHVVEVRAQGPRMIACVVVRADALSIRLCRALGFEMKRGGTGVFGLLGDDAAKLLEGLPDNEREWMATPCGPRETKVFLIAGGTALLSLDTKDGKSVVKAAIR
jgi:hypothetical protein